MSEKALVIMSVVFGLFAALNSADVPCQVNGCNCDHLPTVYCTGLSEFPSVTPHSEAEEIIFDECDFHEVRRENMTAFTGLKRLTITRSNVVRIIPHAFDDLQDLVSLNLSNNPLLLNEDSFKGPDRLKELSLQGCGLLVLPNTEKLDDLEKLWVSDNQNLILDEPFRLSSSLRELHLDNCGLRLPPPATLYLQVQRLRLLNLDHNRFLALDPNQFVYLNQLESLSLEHGVLRTIHERALNSQPDLRQLRLGYNNLSYLHEDTFDHFDRELEVVTLNDNKLTSLSDDLFGSRKNLREVYLANNPWKCDCHIQWMRSLDSNYSIVIDNENLKCAMPAEVAGWNVLNVTSTMNCESEKSVGAITIGVIVVLVCTIAILFAVISIIKKRRAARKQPRNVKYSEVYRDPTERRA